MGSRSHRDGLANSLLPIAIISVPPTYAIGPTEFAWSTLYFAHYPNRSDRIEKLGETDSVQNVNVRNLDGTESTNLVGLK